MDLQIDSNVALVTASSGGLGKAAARALVQNGASVVVNGRTEASLDATAEELQAEAADGATVLPVSADLTDPDDVSRLIETTVDEFGGIDHLVTSAGGPPSGPFLETDDEDWYDAYDLLVMSVVRTIREAAPHLRADDGGTIVTIASRTVKEAVDQMVLSNSVRMGVVGLEKTLSQELAPEVRANAVLPGSHETERVENLIEQGVDRGDFDSYEEGYADRVAEVPLDRLGTTEEFGATVAFLSSPLSGYVNGAAVPVDGGSLGSNL
ncbi:SDR family oxidoreductase [Salinadaptatus halalkaliphilus]|uniref:SDR family oxidoreductase n=1 Tax=Salinadaptatus halalkaliphilus TaxID=2419781 RepID=A0A4S3TJF1_9EURY|nr:SDR family oxidoreductase [Salinadaptatus halalkaliphilus]THE64131.1 SDR family oxidoreductase [Salinadaptatus halalkaliphilus]